jgi:hypothetical protein
VEPAEDADTDALADAAAALAAIPAAAVSAVTATPSGAFAARYMIMNFTSVSRNLSARVQVASPALYLMLISPIVSFSILNTRYQISATDIKRKCKSSNIGQKDTYL